MRRGILTPQFLAAVMAIDLENPVLSSTREELLRFIPDQFRFKLLDPSSLNLNSHPDDLTTQVIANLEKFESRRRINICQIFSTFKKRRSAEGTQRTG